MCGLLTLFCGHAHQKGAHHVFDVVRLRTTSLTDPVGHGRALQGHALTRIDFGLPIQRQMIHVFGHQHMGQQSRPGKPPGNRAARGRNLHDPVTAAAGQLGPHMANNLEARRLVLQNFGHVIAQMTKFAATTMARCYWCSPALKIRPLVPVRYASVGANRCPPTALRVVLSSRIRCRWWLAAKRSAPAQAACRTGTSHRHPTTAI